ncbi:hypothetical protein SY85_00150 [Flavisolibacter tropicus]|uniref:DUF4397 domain-containing protein n=2 Tax=Flavisolibacter tropicus TaxID=1492898 RepID=A0A172TQR0_9BACT|nr:hypothetical protein SY85_00150 [Flavisolibacter tropicus]
MLWSCEKNVLTVSPYEYTDGKALLKINYSCPYIKNPGVQIKINGEKVSSLVTYSTPYPGGGLNTGGNSYADYLAVNAGNNTISLGIPKTGSTEDSVLLFTTQADLTANEYQTLHFTDTAANTQTVLTKDAANKPDSGYTQFTFVNLIPNSTAVDLYFGTDKVASNVAYKQATAPFLLPANTSQAWSVRTAGGTTTLGSSYTSTSSVANQRVFTVYARGYIGPVTTDIRSVKVSFVYNK